MAASFNNPKVKLHFGDGLEFMRQNENSFDIIITDSSDPIGKLFRYGAVVGFSFYTCLITAYFLAGPAETLFTDSYYHLVNKALSENGLLSSQGSDTLFKNTINSDSKWTLLF